MRAIHFSFAVLMISCTATTKQDAQFSFRDSVFQYYKEEMALNRKFDSSEFSYQLLKAYVADDTAALKRLHAEITNERENRKLWAEVDGCIKLPKLSDMDVDEGYRFEYDGAFCSMRQITTIYKRHDTIRLHFVLYQLKWDSAECRKLEESNRILTPANWQDLLNKVDQGDFWGLRSENDRHGFDGSNLYVTGFRKGSAYQAARYHFVHRWEESTLGKAFQFATILAANKQGCLIIRKRNR